MSDQLEAWHVERLHYLVEFATSGRFLWVR